MKTVAIGLWLVCSLAKINAQASQASGPLVEGTKLVVELIKVLSSKRDIEKNPGCRNMHADVCISNEYLFPLVVTLHKRNTHENRELVIQPSQQECSLHLTIGVWTYDLRICDEKITLRKGDLLIEGCQNITMNIKH